jgi:4-amino-4-deoxy-L-arabinose transferase-like glycosyltransferase
LQKVSGGVIKRRQFAALQIPIFCALACVLLYKIGRELQFTPVVSLWGALMLALATPYLTFTRLYYGEAGIAFSVLLAIWAFLRAQNAQGRAAMGWALLAGAGLAGTTACHFNNTFVSMFLWVAMAATFLTRPATDSGMRLKLIAALTMIPVLSAAGLFYMNWSRWGSPLATGYNYYMDRESDHPISLLNIPINAPNLARWVLRAPWVLAAFVFLFKLLPRQRNLSLGLLLGVAAHVLFLAMFVGYYRFHVRYMETAVVLLSVGLMLIGDTMWKRWQARGLFYFGIVLLFWNMAFFIRYDSYQPPFLLSPDGSGVTCYVWYMEPQTVNARRTLMGPFQWTMFFCLGIASLAVLGKTLRDALRLSTIQTEPAAQ